MSCLVACFGRRPSKKSSGAVADDSDQYMKLEMYESVNLEVDHRWNDAFYSSSSIDTTPEFRRRPPFSSFQSDCNNNSDYDSGVSLDSRGAAPVGYRLRIIELKQTALAGKGHYGCVTVVKDREGNRFALKKVFRNAGNNNEAILLNRLTHQNILRIFLWNVVEGSLWILSELCDHDLKRCIYQCEYDGNPAYVRRFYGYMKQLMEAVCYLHSRQIAHRDLKPDNLLLVEGEGGTKVVKLCDFGLAIDCAGAIGRQTGAVGAMSYSAPEVIDAEYEDAAYYDAMKADLFNCGIVLGELITGRLPWVIPDIEADKRFAAFAKGDFNDAVWHHLRYFGLFELAQQFLQISPDKRGDAKSLLSLMNETEIKV